jgi:serine O-acetyltransferase
MIFETLVRFAGGIWSIKKRACTSRSRLVRFLNRGLFARSLQAKGSWIGVTAQFASPPFFPHGPYGVFVSGGAKIGRNCVIFQHVMIASNTLIDSPRLGAPIIGDDCYIGVGAKIVGQVRIGNKVRIGANVVVTNDVPDFSIVSVGEPRVVQWDDRIDNRFYHSYNGSWRYLQDGSWHEVEGSEDLEVLKSRFDAR